MGRWEDFRRAVWVEPVIRICNMKKIIFNNRKSKYIFKQNLPTVHVYPWYTKTISSIFTVHVLLCIFAYFIIEKQNLKSSYLICDKEEYHQVWYGYIIYIYDIYDMDISYIYIVIPWLLFRYSVILVYNGN